jgi:phospholipid-binding lipoprotein MlaA
LLFLEELDQRASYLALDDLVSGDPYLFIREAYVQRRNYLVHDGQLEDEFGDF